VAAIDHNVFQDLVAPRPQGEPTLNLLDDWVLEAVELCITEEVHAEIDGCDDTALRKRMLTHAGSYRVIGQRDDNWRSLTASVARLAPDAGGADHRHVARAVSAGALYFVTRDEDLVRAADGLHTEFGVRVIRPEQLVVHLDLRRAHERYEPESLHATPITAVAACGIDQEECVRAFLNHRNGERTHELREALRRAMASSDEFYIRVFRADDGDLLGLLVMGQQGDLIDVPVMRVAGAGRLSTALARQLAFLGRQFAADNGCRSVTVSDPAPSGAVEGALPAEAYVKHGARWSCELVFGIVDADEMVDPDGINDRSADVARLERTLWPAKLRGGGLRTFMVPIRPAWAEALFDTKLAASTLFGRPLELGLGREHVYYRSPGAAGGIAAPARLLWYVSGQSRFHDVGHIRAVSQLVDVVTGAPESLHRRFSRLGVWDLQQVKAAADSNGRVMALRFVDTEVLERPLDLETLVALFGETGEVFTPPQSPRLAPEHTFCLLYQRASAYGD
jgi:hypothetical protein